MSEELKPCPFCGGEATTTKKGQIRNQWWEVVCVSGECDTASITGDTEKAAIAEWNTRADLLPVVKPLVWERLHSGGIAAVCPSLGLFHISCDENGRFFCYCSGAKIFGTKGFNHEGFDSETEAKKAVSEWREARIRASLDMIAPDALVAGAYVAAAMEFDGWNNVTVQMTYDEARDRIRALTPADAQAALDAAKRNAVNAKLDEVASKVAPMTIKIAGTPYQAGCGQIADAILAMKEPE